MNQSKIDSSPIIVEFIRVCVVNKRYETTYKL